MLRRASAQLHRLQVGLASSQAQVSELSLIRDLSSSLEVTIVWRPWQQGQVHQASTSSSGLQTSTKQSGMSARPRAVGDALAAASALAGGRPHAVGYGKPIILRAWLRGGGRHWRTAWDGSDRGRKAEAKERKERIKQHEAQQYTQSVWRPDSEHKSDDSWPQKPAYRFVAQSRVQPPLLDGPAPASLPAWQRQQGQSPQKSLKFITPIAAAAAETAPTAAVAALPRRSPIYFPDFTLELMKLTSAQEEQVKATGWLPEVAFKTQPHVTKLEIRAFLEAVYGLQVERVATINYLGQKVVTVSPVNKRMKVWRRDDWKKAYVRLRPPPELDLAPLEPGPTGDVGESFMDRVRRVRGPKPQAATVQPVQGAAQLSL